jgi:hypothetical protein
MAFAWSGRAAAPWSSSPCASGAGLSTAARDPPLPSSSRSSCTLRTAPSRAARRSATSASCCEPGRPACKTQRRLSATTPTSATRPSKSALMLVHLSLDLSIYAPVSGYKGVRACACMQRANAHAFSLPHLVSHTPCRHKIRPARSTMVVVNPSRHTSADDSDDGPLSPAFTPANGTSAASRAPDSGAARSSLAPGQVHPILDGGGTSGVHPILDGEGDAGEAKPVHVLLDGPGSESVSKQDSEASSGEEDEGSDAVGPLPTRCVVLEATFMRRRRVSRFLASFFFFLSSHSLSACIHCSPFSSARHATKRKSMGGFLGALTVPSMRSLPVNAHAHFFWSENNNAHSSIGLAGRAH